MSKNKIIIILCSIILLILISISVYFLLQYYRPIKMTEEEITDKIETNNMKLSKSNIIFNGDITYTLKIDVTNKSTSKMNIQGLSSISLNDVTILYSNFDVKLDKLETTTISIRFLSSIDSMDVKFLDFQIIEAFYIK